MSSCPQRKGPRDWQYFPHEPNALWHKVRACKFGLDIHGRYSSMNKRVSSQSTLVETVAQKEELEVKVKYLHLYLPNSFRPINYQNHHHDCKLSFFLFQFIKTQLIWEQKKWPNKSTFFLNKHQDNQKLPKLLEKENE